MDDIKIITVNQENISQHPPVCFLNPPNVGPLPKFKDWKKQLKQYKGLNFIYADQCPWVARSIKELSKIAKEKGLKVKITELKSAKEAQNAPSVYGTFNLVFNGKLLADHYISNRRFLNIIEKELRKK